MPAASRSAQFSGACGGNGKGGGGEGGGGEGGGLGGVGGKGGGEGSGDAGSGGGFDGDSGVRQQTSTAANPVRLYTIAFCAPPSHEVGSPRVGARVEHGGHGSRSSLGAVSHGPHAPPRMGRQHELRHMPAHVLPMLLVTHARLLSMQRG